MDYLDKVGKMGVPRIGSGNGFLENSGCRIREKGTGDLNPKKA